ncbi:MAG: hypothetical protein B9S33_19850, partial [Pedosphaera sp. Tous-C6FEB]
MNPDRVPCFIRAQSVTNTSFHFMRRLTPLVGAILLLTATTRGGTLIPREQHYGWIELMPTTHISDGERLLDTIEQLSPGCRLASRPPVHPQEQRG